MVPDTDPENPVAGPGESGDGAGGNEVISATMAGSAVAHGHVNPPLYATCITNEWQYEGLTDDQPRWEVTPGGAVPEYLYFRS